MPTQKTRAYIYRVAVAVVPLLILFGVIGPDEAQLYLNIAAAVLSLSTTGLAVANTPTTGRHEA